MIRTPITANTPNAIARNLIDTFLDYQEAFNHAVRCADNASDPAWRAAYQRAAEIIESES